MLTLPPGARVFVAATARVDGRKGIDGLSALVRSQHAEDPLSGSMYVFFSRRGDRVRVLYWDRDGYALITKRLEKGDVPHAMERRAGSRRDRGGRAAPGARGDRASGRGAPRAMVTAAALAPRVVVIGYLSSIK
jgi:transposase